MNKFKNTEDVESFFSDLGVEILGFYIDKNEYETLDRLPKYADIVAITCKTKGCKQIRKTKFGMAYTRPDNLLCRSCSSKERSVKPKKEKVEEEKPVSAPQEIMNSKRLAKILKSVGSTLISIEKDGEWIKAKDYDGKITTRTKIKWTCLLDPSHIKETLYNKKMTDHIVCKKCKELKIPEPLILSESKRKYFIMCNNRHPPFEASRRLEKCKHCEQGEEPLEEIEVEEIIREYTRDKGYRMKFIPLDWHMKVECTDFRDRSICFMSVRDIMKIPF